MMGLGLIWMLLFWGGLVALAVWLVGLLFPTAKAQQKKDKALLSAPEILKTRYAQGELSAKEYHEMLNNILSTVTK